MKKRKKPMDDYGKHYDLNLEKAFLAAWIMAGPKGDSILDFIREEDFFNLTNRTIMLEIKRMRAQGIRPDLQLLSNRLKSHGNEMVDRLVGLFDLLPTSVNLVSYAEDLRELTKRRMILEGCLETLDTLRNDPGDEKILPNLQSKLVAIERSVIEETAEQALETELKELEKEWDWAEKNSGYQGIPTGYMTLNRLLGGWKQGVNFVGGWTHMGKTAFLIPSLIEAAEKDFRWRLYSIDMAPRRIITRIYQHMYHISRTRMRNLSEKNKEDLRATFGWVLSKQCAIVRNKRTLEQIINDMRRYAGTYEWVMIDTWQSLDWPGPIRTQYERFCEGVVKIKAVLNELSIPGVITVQAKEPPNRDQIAKGNWNPPGENDLEGGRRLSQEAGVIVMINRKDYGAQYINGNPEPSMAEIIIAKDQSNGNRGVIEMTWQPDVGCFTEKGALHYAD